MAAEVVEPLTDFKAYKAKMNHELPEVMKDLDGLFQASLADGALSLKEKELIVIGISVATHCEPCILVHVEKALAAGAMQRKPKSSKRAEWLSPWEVVPPWPTCRWS